MKTDTLTTKPETPAGLSSSVLFDVGLSDAQRELLALLVEELGESQQAIGKILRHGYESRHPNGGPTNREMLNAEIGDVMAAVEMLHASGDLSLDVILRFCGEKKKRVGKYLHFANTSNDEVSHSRPTASVDDTKNMNKPTTIENGNAEQTLPPASGSASSSELRPCPLCGGRPKIIGGCCLGGLLNNLGIECQTCGLETRSGQFKNTQDLIDFWNAKTPNGEVRHGGPDESK